MNDTTPFSVRSQTGQIAIVPVWVLHQGLTGSQLAVYVSLRSFADRDGSGAFPKQQQIATRAGVSRETVKAALRELRQRDLVKSEQWTREDGSVGGCRYWVRDVPPPDMKLEQESTDVTDSGGPGVVDSQTPPGVYPDTTQGAVDTPGRVSSYTQQDQTKDQITDQTKDHSAALRASGAGRHRIEQTAIDVPTPELPAKEPNSADLVAWYVDQHTQRPPRQVIGQLAKTIKALLDEGFAASVVQTGLKRLVEKGLQPSALAGVVNEVVNGDAVASSRRGGYRSDAGARMRERARQRKEREEAECLTGTR